MKILVIGAGASGLMAAIALAEKGHRVTVLEKMDRPGKKLMATGNGRCNFTNRKIETKNYHGRQAGFHDFVIRRYPSDAIVERFSRWGLYPLELEEGKIFPRSLQSKSMLDVLMRNSRRYGVKMRYRCPVSRIEPLEKGFKVHGDQVYEGDCVVIATGGAVSKNTGSDGSGYGLARGLGHPVTEIFPGIVQLRLLEDTKPLSGVKFPGRVYIEGEEEPREDTGDVLFTDYGISGPPVLQLSAGIQRRMQRGKSSAVFLDLLPEIEDIEGFLRERQEALSYLYPKDFLIGVVHEKLLDTWFSMMHLPLDKTAGEYSREELFQMGEGLKAWKFHVTGPLGLDNGQVTCGGVDTRFVHPERMESIFCPGVYFTGEVLDVDGDCGGYNLHWAWASALVAAEAMDEGKEEYDE